LYELESAGYITRMSGKGTFVARVTPRLEKALGEISSFTEQLSQAGFAPATRVLSAKVIQAAEARGTRVVEGFGIPGDAEVIHVKRLREGGGAPFAIQSVYLLPELCPNVLEEDLSHLFRLYEEKYGRRMMRADEIIRVSGASTEEAKLLQVDPGTPVVIRDRISYDQDDEPFEILHSVDRGDRFEYRYMILNDATEVPGVSGGVTSLHGVEKRRTAK
jgi:GntR family transcriptional regulator